MTSVRHCTVLVLALLVACPPTSAEAEPKAEAVAGAKPAYDSDANTRSSSRFGSSRSINLGLTRDTDYQGQAGLGSSRTGQFVTTNQFGHNSQLGSPGYQADQLGANRFDGSQLTGTSHFATSGLRNNQLGANHIGVDGQGYSQFGTTGSVANRFGTGGLGSSQFGTSRFGTNQYGTGGLGSSQFGTSRFGTNQYGTGGLGSSQFGTSRFGTNQYGTGGLASSRFGASGLTSNNRLGTNQFGDTGSRNNQYGSNQFETTGFGLGTSQFGSNLNTRLGSNQFGTSGYGSNQLGSNRFGSNQFNRNSLQSGFATKGGILNHRSENDGAGQYSFGRQGLVDTYGNALTDQHNQFQTSNLHNLVSQNRNAFGNDGRFAGSSTYSGIGGFNRNNPTGFGSTGYTSPISSGNFLGTTVLRRRLPYNQDEASIAAFNRQVLQNYGRDDTRGSLFIDDPRLLNNNRYLQGGLYNQNNLGRFGQNYGLGQAGYSTLGSDSDEDFERIIELMDQRLRDGESRRFSGRDGRSGTRFGEFTSQGFLSPVFQQQTASRLAIQEGGNSRQPFGRLLNLRRFDDDLSTHSDLYHASDLTIGMGGSGASHVFKS